MHSGTADKWNRLWKGQTKETSKSSPERYFLCRKISILCKMLVESHTKKYLEGKLNIITQVSILRFFVKCKDQNIRFWEIEGCWFRRSQPFCSSTSGFPGNWLCKSQNSNILQHFWVDFEVFPGICWQKWIELVKITLSTDFFWKIPRNSWDISDFLK